MSDVVRTDAADGLAGHLFVDPAFLAYQAGAQGKALATFIATDARGEPAASLTLGGRDGAWASPITGAFGGVAAAEGAPAEAVFAAADAATAWLKAERLKGAVRLAPDAFADPTAAALENALFRAGWRLAQSDLNYHLPVSGVDAFLLGLGETKQKEIRRLKRSGAAYARLSGADGERAYAAIAANRAARGFPMTMSWPQVAALAEALPERVAFSAVERGGDVLAGAICLRLAPAYVYVFYWGETPAFRRESPVMLLAEGLVADCVAAGVRVLDLGTSSDASVPNPGLIAFKLGLGCLATGKRTYQLDAA